VIVDIAVVPKKKFLIHSNFCANGKSGDLQVKMTQFEGFLMIFGSILPRITSSLRDVTTRQPALLALGAGWLGGQSFEVLNGSFKGAKRDHVCKIWLGSVVS
jgi:hypothetical protein